MTVTRDLQLGGRFDPGPDTASVGEVLNCHHASSKILDCFVGGHDVLSKKAFVETTDTRSSLTLGGAALLWRGSFREKLAVGKVRNPTDAST